MRTMPDKVRSPPRPPFCPGRCATPLPPSVTVCPSWFHVAPSLTPLPLLLTPGQALSLLDVVVEALDIDCPRHCDEVGLAGRGEGGGCMRAHAWGPVASVPAVSSHLTPPTHPRAWQVLKMEPGLAWAKEVDLRLLTAEAAELEKVCVHGGACMRALVRMG